MLFVGGAVYSPIGTAWFYYLNPWYIAKAIPFFWKSFPQKHKYI